MKKIIPLIFILIFSLTFTKLVYAHEVYVIDPQHIQNDLKVTDMNVFDILKSGNNFLLFLIFILVTLFVLFLIFLTSKTHFVKSINIKIDSLKDYASTVIRVILGISFIFCAINKSLFGPEIPLDQLGMVSVLQIMLIISGILVILGFMTRFVSVVIISIFILATLHFHGYMITYLNYLGECIALLLMGGEKLSMDNLFSKDNKFILQIKSFGIKYAFTILRISFGISLLYAAIYVKFLHPSLSIDVIKSYSLTKIFPFDAAFIVLVAGCIESIIGILFILGIFLRSNVIFFLSFVTASLLFFGESVWPHYILYGIATGIFLYGYNQPKKILNVHVVNT